MTNKEMLQAYREAVMAVEELTVQLARTGHDGRPLGMGTAQLGSGPRTNNAMAASMQAMDGVGEMLARKRDELAALAVPVCALLSRIGDAKTYMVVQRYYLQAETDAAIAHDLSMSRCRVNQIRNQYLAQVC